MRRRDLALLPAIGLAAPIGASLSALALLVQYRAALTVCPPDK